MKGPKYPNQPLVEVAAEVRFAGDLRIEAFRCQFQELLKDDYPKLLVPGAQTGVSPALQHYRFESSDGESAVQLSVNSLGCFTRNYPGFSMYREQVAHAVGLVQKSEIDFQIKRIGWRYVNRIPIVREGGYVPVGRYFSSVAGFTMHADRNLKDIDLAVVQPRGETSIRISLKAMESQTEEGAEYLFLDTDAYRTVDSAERVGMEDAMGMIDEVHKVASDEFEAMITDDYRMFLRGGDDE